MTVDAYIVGEKVLDAASQTTEGLIISPDKLARFSPEETSFILGNFKATQNGVGVICDTNTVYAAAGRQQPLTKR